MDVGIMVRHGVLHWVLCHLRHGHFFMGHHLLHHHVHGLVGWGCVWVGGSHGGRAAGVVAHVLDVGMVGIVVSVVLVVCIGHRGHKQQQGCDGGKLEENLKIEEVADMSALSFCAFRFRACNEDVQLTRAIEPDDLSRL
jgi:hypothetical protein